MTELVFLLLCGLLVAGVICRPDGFLFRYVRRREEWFPEPYLGEFVPAETEAERQDRERLAEFKVMVRKAG